MGRIEQLEKQINYFTNIEQGKHAVLLYEDKKKVMQSAVPFIKAGIEKNERAIYIDGAGERKVIISKLEKYISGISEYLDTGQLLILTADEYYGEDDSFDADKMVEKLKDIILTSKETGFSSTRITGEMSNFYGSNNSKENIEKIIDYEWKLNKEIFSRHPITALCRYDINQFNNEVIKAAIELHHYIIWKNEINENPYYIPPAEYKDNKIIEYEIENWLENIRSYNKNGDIFKQMLEKSEEKYESLFNSAPIGIIRTTAAGKVISVNQTMAEMAGFKNASEAVRSYNDLSSEFYKFPERRKDFLELLKKNGSAENFELEAVKKNGETIWININARVGRRINDDNFIIEGYVFDITENKRIQSELKNKQEELNASNQQLNAYNQEIEAVNQELEITQFAVDKADIIIFRTSPDGTIRYANELACQKLGYTREEMIGMKNKVLIPDEQFVDQDEFWNALNKDRSIKFQKELIKKDGSRIPVEMRTLLLEYKGEEYEFAFGNDISKRKKAQSQLEYLSYHDKLTGVYNRTFFEEELKRYDNKRQLPIALILLDLNGLKLINETYGHKTGDQLLIKTADMLEKVIRKGDTLARLGGDEFAVILPRTNRDEVDQIINKIKEKNAETAESKLHITLGIGSSVKTEIDENIYDIFYEADDRMYKDKLTKGRSEKSKLVKNLLDTLGAKSSETKDHALRMARLAVELGEKLELPNDDLNKLNLLAILHDIGKATISEEILTKSGKLSDEEWEIIKEHPAKGKAIAAASEEFLPIAKYILHHHESYDGSGYPDGLAGDEIPLLSRIISIIDAYDVMTHSRSYNKVKSREEAVEEIRECAGTQFDPYLAENFIEMINKEDDFKPQDNSVI